MPGIQCTLCSLWFASELGLKIHYSKKHSPVAECNRKRKAACNSTQNEYLNDDMLWALCKAFAEPGEEDKELLMLHIFQVVLRAVLRASRRTEQKDYL